MKVKTIVLIFCLFLLTACGVLSQKSDKAESADNINKLENVKDQQGNVIEQFATTDRGRKLHAKPIDLIVNDIFFVAKAGEGKIVLFKALRLAFRGRVWFTRDVTDPNHPIYIAAAVVRGHEPILEIDGRKIARISSAYVDAVDYIGVVPRFEAVELSEELEVEEIDQSVLSGLKLPIAPPKDYKKHTPSCNVVMKNGKHYVQVNAVQFLFYENKLFAVADIDLVKN